MKHTILIILLTLGVWGQEVGVPYVDTREAVAQSAALSPDGEYFYTARNGEISKWSINPIKKVKSLPNMNGYRFLLTLDGKKMIFLGEDKSFTVINLTSNIIEKRVQHNYEIVHAIVNKTSLFTLHADRTLREWDISTLSEKRKMVIPKNELLNSPQDEIRYTMDTDQVCVMFPTTDLSTVNVLTTTQNILIDNQSFKIVQKESGSCPAKVTINHKKIATPTTILDIDTRKVKGIDTNKQFLIRYKNTDKWVYPSSFENFVFINKKQHTYMYDLQKQMLIAELYQLSKDIWLIITPNGYFDGSPETRKYLYVKTSSGESVPIDDATYEKFHKQINLKD